MGSREKIVVSDVPTPDWSSTPPLGLDVKMKGERSEYLNSSSPH